MQHYRIKQINSTPVVKVNSFMGLKYTLLYSLYATVKKQIKKN